MSSYYCPTCKVMVMTCLHGQPLGVTTADASSGWKLPTLADYNDPDPRDAELSALRRELAEAHKAVAIKADAVRSAQQAFYARNEEMEQLRSQLTEARAENVELYRQAAERDGLRSQLQAAQAEVQRLRGLYETVCKAMRVYHDNGCYEHYSEHHAAIEAALSSTTPAPARRDEALSDNEPRWCGSCACNGCARQKALNDRVTK